MPRFWPWLRRPRVASRPKAADAPSRPLLRSVRLDLDCLENRLVPATVAHDVWAQQRFRVDDAALADRATVTATAAQTNQSFGSLIGLDVVQASTPFRGAGYTVAVIDTGIDYTHPDLGGGWGRRVIAGYDFVNRDADPMDDNGHGTHVAGIVGSSSGTYAGVAPDVRFVALKVLGRDGSGSFGLVEEALQWVVANRSRYNIAAINLSLGSGNYTSNPYDFLDDEFATLRAQGVFLSVAAGNSFYAFDSRPGVDYPAISPNVVSVGAVWNGTFGPASWASGAEDRSTAPDRVASFSQRGPSLGILAPGAMVNSTYLAGAYQLMAGTSMASPVAAGSAIVLRQALESLGRVGDQAAVLSLMRSTGKAIVDGDDEDDNVVNTGATYRRLDLAAAFRSLGLAGGAANAAPTLETPANRTLAPGTSTTLGLVAADADGDTLSYSARVVGVDASASQAYALKQSLGLVYLGSYYTNAWGQNEKWLGGRGGSYYALLPSGELRLWTGTLASTLGTQNLVASLGPAVYADPSLLWNAQPVSVPLSASLRGNQLTLTAAAGASGVHSVEVSVTDGKAVVAKTFAVTLSASAANQAPVWSAIPAQKMATRQDTCVVALSARDADGDALAYSVRLVGAPAGARAMVTGNQLVLDPPTGFVGSFTVEATASDGKTSATTNFTVDVTNQAPTLTVASQTNVAAGARSASVPFVATDADGDPVTVTASLVAGDSQNYLIRTTYGLSYAGSYYANWIGLGEKWLVSSDGRQWYCLLPSGELRKFASSATEMMKPANLIATLDPSVFADPSRLWNAAPATAPKATVAVVGNQVTVTLQETYRGTLTLELVATDGVATTKRTVSLVFA